MDALLKSSTFDHKLNTTDVDWEPYTHIKCQQFQTPTQDQGFYRSVHFVCQ